MQATLFDIISSGNTLDTTISSVASTNQEGGGDDFLSLLVSSIKENGDLEIDMQTAKSAISASAANSLKLDLSTELQSTKTTDNLNFVQVLNLLETINGGKVEKFPILDNVFDKFFATEQNIIELKGAKNLSDLFKIAQKLNLNLENIEITNDDIQMFKNEFKALDSIKFFDVEEMTFDPIKTKQIQNDINQIKDNTPKTEVAGLDKLLQDIKDEVAKKDTKQEKISLNKEDESIKSEIPKHEPKKTLEHTSNKTTKQAAEHVVTIHDKPKVHEKPKHIDTKIKSKQQFQLNTQNLDSNADEINSKINLSSKSNKEVSIDEYLASISQKAKQSLEKEQQIATNPQKNDTSIELSAEDSIEINDDIKLTNEIVKNAVGNAKLQMKNIDFRQTMQTFANELQEKINEYKPPITRFHMTLNPAELGEVSVTMVGRADNLHININSSNQTMQIFLLNQAEFKQNLINMGFTDVQMNFNAQDGSQNNKDEQKNKQARQAYENASENEINELPNISLEIILPKYA